MHLASQIIRMREHHNDEQEENRKGRYVPEDLVNQVNVQDIVLAGPEKGDDPKPQQLGGNSIEHFDLVLLHDVIRCLGLVAVHLILYKVEDHE